MPYTVTTASRWHRFEDGLTIGAAVASLFLVLLLVVLVPTNEFRARIWFILASTGPGVPLEVWFVVAIWCPSAIALWRMQRASVWALLGAAFASFACVAALSFGAFKWVPEFQNLFWRVALVIGVITVTGWAAWGRLRASKGTA
jgi:hypothetical protein